VAAGSFTNVRTKGTPANITAFSAVLDLTFAIQGPAGATEANVESATPGFAESP
jgi:hypothetical protein